MPKEPMGVEEAGPTTLPSVNVLGSVGGIIADMLDLQGIRPSTSLREGLDDVLAQGAAMLINSLVVESLSIGAKFASVEEQAIGFAERMPANRVHDEGDGKFIEFASILGGAEEDMGRGVVKSKHVQASILAGLFLSEGLATPNLMDGPGVSVATERASTLTFLKDLHLLPCRPHPKALGTSDKLPVLVRDSFGCGDVCEPVKAPHVLQA